MAKTIIPARHVITCDCCNKEFNGKNSAKEGRLELRRHALDYQGVPVADASIRLDLCDSCLDDIAEAINEVKTRIMGSAVAS